MCDHDVVRSTESTRMIDRSPLLSCAAQKACIDQERISESLACLPIFLSGCRAFLVVAGPTCECSPPLSLPPLSLLSTKSCCHYYEYWITSHC